jgi:hypothetical protein
MFTENHQTHPNTIAIVKTKPEDDNFQVLHGAPDNASDDTAGRCRSR